MYKLQITLIILLLSFLGLSQRSKNGSYIVSAQGEVVNTYTTLSADASAGSNTIVVDDNTLNGANFSGPLESQDLLLIYQVQGGSVNVNTYTYTAGWGDYVVQNSFFDSGPANGVYNFIEFGEVLNYKNVGNFEFVEVLSVSGNQDITLTCDLTKNFSTGDNNKTQVIRIPRFEDLEVPNNTSITTPKWDGNTGGVVAVEVSGNLTVSGSGKISADSTGFRGGLPVNNNSTSPAPGSISNINDRGYLGSPDPGEGSAKGESIYGDTVAYDNIFSRYSYGSIANGGGGGGYHNAGGGGGSNVGTGDYYGYGIVDQGPGNAYNPAWTLESAQMISNPSAGGGRGGYSYGSSDNDPLTVGPHNSAWDIDYRRISGGVGGHPLAYDADRAFMGGGGGAGHGNDEYGGLGGDGGGVVFLTVYGDVTGDGTISANGEKGGNAEGSTPSLSGKSGDDGAGGAGGGGSVFIKNINNLPATLQLEAKGGEGGDQVLQLGAFNNDNQVDGPGGAGAGGLIAFSSGNPMEDVVGGAAGESNSSFVVDFPVNGATGGAEGLSSQPTIVFDIIAEDDTICEGESTTLTADIIGNLTPEPLLSWYDAPVGGNLLASGNPFNTPNLSTTTTYYAGTCPGTFRVPVTVVVSPEIIITGAPPTITDETCAGNDGSIAGLTASGGIGQLIYEWNGSASPTADLTDTVGGTYTLTVTDSIGCSATEGPFTINPSPGPSIDISNMNITDESCTGNDGNITGITVSGGATPYSYSWNGTSSSDADLTGATNGSYTLTVTDDAGCSQTSGPHTIDPASTISFDDSNIIIEDELCSGGDGSISGITATGTGLSYAWSPSGETTIDADSISSGSYTLEITDGAGCSVTAGPYVVDDLPGIVVDASNVNIMDETCNGNDGSITGISFSGGTSPFSYEWNGNNATSEDLSNATAGTYNLTITDDNGCSEIAGPFTIDSDSGPVIDASNVNVNDETCTGNDGSITGLTVSGGQTPYAYEWNGVTATDADLTGATGGNYTLTVTDDNGCTTTSGPYTIDGITAISIDETNMTVSDESCNGNDGSITGINVSGGTGSLDYSWSSGETTLDINNLSSGSYTLTVSDGMGCSETFGPYTINQIPGPTVDDANVIVNEETCGLGNGSISGISATGTGLSYAWSPSGVTTLDVDNLSNGTHTLVITDVAGCTVSSGPYTINNAAGPSIDTSAVSITNDDCFGNNGSITGITISGGTAPFTYEWNGSTTSSEDLMNVSEGTYNLSITDANGCEVQAGPFTVSGLTIPTVSIGTPDQIITEGESVSISSSVNPTDADIIWSPDEDLTCSDCTDPEITPNESGWYVITAISSDGCKVQDSVYIEIKDPCGSVEVPTVFSPNGDGLNDQLCVLGNCVQAMQLQIFSRWGELVFQTTDITECWDGTYKGKPLNPGTFVYQLEGTDAEGKSINKSGNVNLMR